MRREICRIKYVEDLPDAIRNNDIVVIRKSTSELLIKFFREQFNDEGVVVSHKELRPQQTRNHSIGKSNSYHPPHIDGAYLANPPSHICLQCVYSESTFGGIGKYWQLEDLINTMPKNLQKTLFELPVTYSRITDNGLSVESFTGPILYTNSKGDGRISIRYRYDSIVRPRLSNATNQKDRELFESALAMIQNYLVVGPDPYTIPYETGDIVITSNRHVLHGRQAIGSNNRVMNRYWLNIN